MDAAKQPSVQSDAIIVVALSFIVLFLDYLPLLWHIRNRNVGAAAIIFWTCVLNTMALVNALFWPYDSMMNVWNGWGLCDVEVRLQVASLIGVPCAVACIMMELAAVLNLNRGIGAVGQGNKRWSMIVKLLLCFGPALWYMAVYIFVQPNRYVLATVRGCVMLLDHSWVSIVLISAWPLLMSLVSAYLAGNFSPSSGSPL